MPIYNIESIRIYDYSAVIGDGSLMIREGVGQFNNEYHHATFKIGESEVILDDIWQPVGIDDPEIETWVSGVDDANIGPYHIEIWYMPHSRWIPYYLVIDKSRPSLPNALLFVDGEVAARVVTSIADGSRSDDTPDIVLNQPRFIPSPTVELPGKFELQSPRGSYTCTFNSEEIETASAELAAIFPYQRPPEGGQRLKIISRDGQKLVYLSGAIKKMNGPRLDEGNITMDRLLIELQETYQQEQEQDQRDIVQQELALTELRQRQQVQASRIPLLTKRQPFSGGSRRKSKRRKSKRRKSKRRKSKRRKSKRRK